MFNPIRNLSTHRRRPFWLAEAALVAGILVFGGLTLLTDARIIKAFDLPHGFTHILSR